MRKQSGKKKSYNTTVTSGIHGSHICKNRRTFRPAVAQRDSMNLPQWVQEEIELLPAEFTGQIVIVWWQGGVSRIETKTIRTAPKAGEMKRDERK